MRVYLPPLDRPYTSLVAARFARLASSSTRHCLCGPGEDPDIVLFTQAHQFPYDWRLRSLQSHPLRLKWPNRCFIYDERDFPWCALPGLYVSMPSHSFSRFQRAVSYYWINDCEFTPLRGLQPDLLFSFMGSPTHPVRRRVLNLRCENAVIEDTSGFAFEKPDAPGFAAQRRRFIELMSRSKFVLCPRGHGTSSIRLFEVMAAGRIPVIISDDWVPQVGPNWEACSIRWPESEVADLPRRLKEEDEMAAIRMQRAASEYDQHFSEQVRFDKMIDLVGDLRSISTEFPCRGVHNRQYFRAALRALRSDCSQWRERTRNRFGSGRTH